MTLLKRFDATDQFPEFYLNFYGRIGWRFDPLQVCAEKSRRAFEAALSLGKVDIAFYCSVHVIKNSFLSGTNLKSVLKEIDYFLHLLKTYKKEFPLNFLLIFRETASLLIDNGMETSIEATPSVGDLDDPGNKLRESLIFHRAIQSFWFGHAERCRYHCGKCSTVLGPLGQLNGYMSKFYHGKTACSVSHCILAITLNSDAYISYILSPQLTSTCISQHMFYRRNDLVCSVEEEELLQRQGSDPCSNRIHEGTSCQLGVELRKQATSP